MGFRSRPGGVSRLWSLLGPPSHAQALHAAAVDSALHRQSSGHNDTPPPWPWMKTFFQERGLLP